VDLHDKPLGELLDAWDALDGAGRDPVGMRALCLEDRYYLLVKGMRRTDLLHPWLYARCREVERNPDGYLDLWAREHYKSTIITFAGIVQEVLRNPEVTVGIFSHTSPIAKAFLRQIKREFEANEVLKAIFPDVLYDNPWKDAPVWSLDAGITVKRKSNQKESTVEAHGLVDGQPISRHFSLLVYDDVVVPASVSTPEQVQKTTEAWELSDNLGAQGGRKWHIGTRYSYADTYEEMLKRGAVKPRIYPATHDGLITGNPVLLDPVEWKRKVRDQGEATVSCQMLQNPLAGQQRMFDIEDLRVYEVRPETLMVYILCDPGRSKKTDSDNSAFAVVGMDYSGNKYLLDGFRHKMDLSERWTALRHLYVKWSQASGVQGVMVGYEEYGAQADLDYFRERQGVERLSFEIQELNWPRDGNASKIDRVQRLTPDLRNHRFFVPYPTDQKNLTTAQRNAKENGYEYRVSKRILRKDAEGVYDLTEALKMELHYFPLAGKKDLVDAVSRLYDMDPVTPQPASNQYHEPEYT
jgi:hypothetical protein